MAESCISGAALINSRQSLEEMVGRDVVERSLELLGEADRETYLSARADSWVPTRIADELQRAVASEAKIPVDSFAQFVREFSHRSVARMVGTVWKLVLRFTSDESLIQRTPELFSHTYNVGHLSTVIEAPGRGVVTLTGWPDVSDEQMIGTAAGVEAVLQEAGRKNVAVRWRRTLEGVIYSVSWDV